MMPPDDYMNVERRFTPELVDAILDGDTSTGDPAAERLSTILAELRAEILQDPSDELAERHLDEIAMAYAEGKAGGGAALVAVEGARDRSTPLELSRKVPTLERKGGIELSRNVPTTLERKGVTSLERKRARAFPGRRRLVGVAATASVIFTGGLAAAGELPAPAQAAVSRVVSFVGIHVPDGHEGEEQPNHGSEVSGVAKDIDAAGCEKGAEISAIASSNAADHRASEGNGHSCGAAQGQGSGDPGNKGNNGQGNAFGHGKDHGKDHRKDHGNGSANGHSKDGAEGAENAGHGTGHARGEGSGNDGTPGGSADHAHQGGAKPDDPPGGAKPDDPPGGAKPDDSPGGGKPDDAGDGETSGDSVGGGGQPGSTSHDPANGDTTRGGSSLSESTSA
jgi:hypothetical protein